VGTLEERKNAATLLRAIAKTKGLVPVVLIGKTTSYVDHLKKLVTELKIDRQIYFLHQVAFEHLPAVYQMAEVFVYPSLFEGFGIPIVEAIASGVPVITSKGSCFSEAGGPATRYTTPSDVDELANQIDLLLGNKELRKEIVNQSQKYVERFQPPVIAGELMRVYRELI
jgi:glycosyltransferase involved in cell wall biosynthesis